MNMRNIVVVTFLLLVAVTANASYLTNGDFEMDPGTQGKWKNKTWANLGWSVWDKLPGWQTLYGPGIEVEKSGVVTTAQSGNHYLELDSHMAQDTNSAMYQTVALSEGDYALSFWYFARTNNGQDDNGIFAGIDFFKDSTIDYFAYTEANSTKMAMDGKWKEYTLDFSIAAAGDYNVTFGAFGKDNSLGGFIDNVSLVQNPEPSTMILFGFGLLGLARLTRRSHNRLDS